MGFGVSFYDSYRLGKRRVFNIRRSTVRGYALRNHKMIPQNPSYKKPSIYSFIIMHNY